MNYVNNQTQLPPFLSAYPFYYNPVSIPFGCASYDINGNCNYIVQGTNTLNFADMPMDGCLPGGKDANNPAVCVFAPGAPLVPPFIGIGFTTQLVGICSMPSPACNVSAPNTQWTWAPLYQWTWYSDFNGSSGGIFGVAPGNLYPADPGSGTGGVTITSINGVPQTPPNVTCSATPSTLWPPNGKPAVVTVSGIVTPGTQAIPSGGTAYTVVDEYGQVQPSGTIALGAGGTYSFGVPLIAARNGDDQDGRTYTIVVAVRDQIGNTGSCSTVVTVPHDQGN